MKTTYSVTAISINDGSKTVIHSDLTRKRDAVRIAEANKGSGIYCEVEKRQSFVIPHCIHQTATGK